MIETDNRHERLGTFLRAHRARLSPQQMGLSAGARRRTPGLRREEVAQLAGISATWYMRIEQGREVSASPMALDRIARALRLTGAERTHLFTLANRHDPLAGASGDGEDRLSLLQESLSTINVPAYIIDRHWDARGWNTQAGQLFLDWLGPGPGDDSPRANENRPNLLRYVFLDERARAFITGWEDRARRLVAECRADLARRREDAQLLDMITALRAGSADFARWWDEQHVLDPEGGERRFMHPRQGPLAYEQVNFLPTAAPGFRLVMLLPMKP